MIEWRDGLVRWRRSLSPTDRQSHGATARSDCRDLKFFVGRINFEQLGAQRAFELNSIPTRFRNKMWTGLFPPARMRCAQTSHFARSSAASTEKFLAAASSKTP
jgi:hypothetical protein